MNVLKNVAVVVAVLGLVGCASVGGVANKYVNNDKVEGLIYGANLGAKSAGDTLDVKEVCNAIKNNDSRCFEQDKYKAVWVVAKFGFSDAAVGMISFAPASMDVGVTCVSGSAKCTYLKAKVEKGRLGTVLEVASRPGDGKCHWGGLPRAGGTVCPAYNYDYSKDFIGIPR